MDGLIIFGCVVCFLILFQLISMLSRYFDRRTSRNISDTEFLAAIPNVNAARALRIRAIISHQLDVPVSDIHPDDRFAEDLGAD